VPSQKGKVATFPLNSRVEARRKVFKNPKARKGKANANFNDLFDISFYTKLQRLRGQIP
jgi:hypothetical protein